VKILDLCSTRVAVERKIIDSCHAMT